MRDLMYSLTCPQTREMKNVAMMGITSTIIARYHEMRMLAAAQKSQACTLSLT